MTNGIDIVQISRFKDLIENENFMKKVFTTNELEYFKKIDFKPESIAGVYAAKEALLKALKGTLSTIDFKDIEVAHENSGCPYFQFYNELKEKVKTRSFSLSISHDGDYAIASVISFEP